MKKRGGSPLPLGDILRTQVRSLNWERKFREMEVFDRWESIVGPRIAEHATPLGVKKKRLAIAVESPAWSQQLTFLKRDILKNITELLGPGIIEDIYLTGGLEKEAAASPAAEPEPFETVAPDDEVARAIDSSTIHIKDRELQKALRQLLLTASCRKRRDR
jgi:predicted nucleic acid-binding Zn ribbon protein